MRKSRKRGATLSLVAVVVLVIIMVGMACFFLAKIVGGARELQNATDAGNLNVAKTALRNPHLNFFVGANTDLTGSQLVLDKMNFAPQVDSTNGELDLLTFNRCVGQAMLVSMNAASDGNRQGVTNAQTLLDALYNPQYGVGTLLANKLKADSAVDNNFLNVAKSLPMRMLNVGGVADTLTVDKDVSYMVPSTATNLPADAALVNSIPQDYINNVDKDFLKNNTCVQNGVTYIKGYTQISIPGVTDGNQYPLMGVAMRPGDKPHLVRLETFKDLQKSPLPGDSSQPAASRIPPNAFKNTGWSAEIKSTKALQTLSCAIIGTTSKVIDDVSQYHPQIPNGYIVVRNAAGTSAGDGIHTGNDIFSDLLMNNHIQVDSSAPHAMSQMGGVTAIQDWKQQQQAAGLPTAPVPGYLVNGLDGPLPLQQTADAIQPGDQVAVCNNKNSAAGPNANQICVDNLQNMADVYHTSIQPGNGGNRLNGLMAIEAEKSAVMTPRPGGGPAYGVGNVCTGLKQYPWTGIDKSAPIAFGSTPTLGELLNDFRSYQTTSSDGSKVYNQVITRLWQMASNEKNAQGQVDSNASQSAINGILASSVPMGQVRYIWIDQAGTFHNTDSSGLPAWINPNTLPDGGPPLVVNSGGIGVDNVFVNFDGEQGYPHPWDCPSITSSTNNQEAWQRSSGFNGLLGVLDFQNCVNDSGSWSCPC